MSSTLKVRYLKTVTLPEHLACAAGSVRDLDKFEALILVDQGYGELVQEEIVPHDDAGPDQGDQ